MKHIKGLQVVLVASTLVGCGSSESFDSSCLLSHDGCSPDAGHGTIHNDAGHGLGVDGGKVGKTTDPFSGDDGPSGLTVGDDASVAGDDAGLPVDPPSGDDGSPEANLGDDGSADASTTQDAPSFVPGDASQACDSCGSSSGSSSGSGSSGSSAGSGSASGDSSSGSGSSAGSTSGDPGGSDSSAGSASGSGSPSGSSTGSGSSGGSSAGSPSGCDGIVTLCGCCLDALDTNCSNKCFPPDAGASSGSTSGSSSGSGASAGSGDGSGASAGSGGSAGSSAGDSSGSASGSSAGGSSGSSAGSSAGSGSGSGDDGGSAGSSSGSAPDAGSPGSTCTLTQGYWRNHPAAWPVQAVVMGATTYSEALCLTIIATPPSGDASLILAHQLIAAVLNGGTTDPNVSAAVASAEAWMSANGTTLAYGTDANSAAGQQAVAISATLDAYNNGLLGTPHCP